MPGSGILSYNINQEYAHYDSNGGNRMKSECIQLYKKREDVTLTTYVWTNSRELLDGRKRPAVLICPGGGYFNCSDREAEPIALRFAAMGYHAFVLRYSTYSEGGAFPDISKPIPVKERLVHPAPMRDIGAAMQLICKRSEEWLVDTDRIAVCGFSAGGHNAAMYATRWQEYGFPRPAAAILGYPLTDYVFKHEYESRQEDGVTMFFHASDTAFLGTPEPAREQLEDVSPAHHVTKDTPPTFLWATAADELVPVQHSLLMATALANAGVPFEIHVFEEGKHGMGLADQASAQALSDCNADADGWAELVGKWLKKRFALPLPEKSAFELMMEAGGFPG